MAKKCYFIEYVNCAGVSGSGYYCSESIVYNPTGGSCGGGWFESADLGFNVGSASEQSGSVTIVAMSFCPGCDAGAGSHDCINGACVPKETYNTQGIFTSLTECQAVCTSNGCSPPGSDYCPPGKVCITSAEWAQIEQLASLNKSKHCG